MILIDRHHAEAACILEAHIDAPHCDVRVVADVKTQHWAVVHLVDVIPAQHEHELRLVFGDQIKILVHGVRGAAVPRVAQALLSRHDFHEFPELAAQKTPGLMHVADQRMRHVLGENRNAPDTRIDTVRQIRNR